MRDFILSSSWGFIGLLIVLLIVLVYVHWDTYWPAKEDILIYRVQGLPYIYRIYPNGKVTRKMANGLYETSGMTAAGLKELEKDGKAKLLNDISAAPDENYMVYNCYGEIIGKVKGRDHFEAMLKAHNKFASSHAVAKQQPAEIPK